MVGPVPERERRHPKVVAPGAVHDGVRGIRSRAARASGRRGGDFPDILAAGRIRDVMYRPGGGALRAPAVSTLLAAPVRGRCLRRPAPP